MSKMDERVHEILQKKRRSRMKVNEAGAPRQTPKFSKQFCKQASVISQTATPSANTSHPGHLRG